MALSPSQIRDNPWWKGVEEIRQDPDLLRLRKEPVLFEHPIPFSSGADAVFTLRGPRQVGKSTLLKRMVEDLLMERGVPPRNVMYFDVEGAGITTPLRLRNALSAYLDWVRSSDPDGRVYLLLDEVTGVQDWGTAVRVLYRRGALEGVTMVVTGSHALDVRRGGETAPGRRGEGEGRPLDWIMMPLAFRDYIRAHAPAVAGKLPAVDLLDPGAAFQAAREAELFSDTTRPLFQRYLLTGGYPHPLRVEHATGRVPFTLYQLQHQAAVGQVRRAGHREALFREIVSWAAQGRLGREFSWRDISGGTDIGSKNTAREYVESAEAMFLWHVYYRCPDPKKGAPALRSPKKLYPADPFAWHVLAGWARGEADPWGGSLDRVADPARRGELVESVAADHFRRVFGPLAYYFRSPRGEREVNFLLFRGDASVAVEVKYQARIAPRDARALAAVGGGILAAADHLDWDEKARVAKIPLSALLATLAEPASLFPLTE